MHSPNKNKIDLSYLGSASLSIKDYFECTLKIFQSDFPRSQIRWFSKKLKVSNWKQFIYSWRDLTPLLQIHLKIAKSKFDNFFDAIKASVPKFLNFLGAELNTKWITHFEGITLHLAENTDRNQISKKFINLPKIRFKIIIWIMQKIIFLPRRKY